MPEPTLATIADRLDLFEKRVEEHLTEMHTQMVNLRADVATFRLDTITRLTTLFDEVAAFRAEYNDHTHG